MVDEKLPESEQNPGVPAWSQPPAERTEAERKSDKEHAERRADKIADAQIDPGTAARLAAVAPEPVYTLPNQAEGNPPVQGYVFRPHQEKNPGTGVEPKDREKDELAQKVRLEKDARERRWSAYREAAEKRGDPVPERVGPQRLRMSVDVNAHSVIEEEKLAAVAAAADALVAAIRDAGVEPKADVSGIPF